MFDLAVDALDHIFFIGIQEEYEISVKVMLKELDITVETEVKKERDQQNSKSLTRQKAAIKANLPILERMRVVNSWDMQLYQIGNTMQF